MTLAISWLMADIALAASPEIREVQRKLFVLGHLGDAKIDGIDSPALRKSISTFLSDENETDANDAELASLLDKAIAAATRAQVGPYDDPKPFDRPAFSHDYASSILVSTDDNLVLAGSCQNISRYRIDSGLPLKRFDGAHAGLQFTYSSSRKEIICPALWDEKNAGILIIDANTGIQKDFILIPGPPPYDPLSVVDSSGEHVWILSANGIWSIDLANRRPTRLTKAFANILTDRISVSTDGRIVAVEVTYTPQSGRQHFPHEIRVYDAITGKQLSVLTNATGLLLSSDGARYLAARNGKYEIHDSRTGDLITSRTFDSDAPSVDKISRNATFTADGGAVLYTSADEEDNSYVVRWDINTSELSRMPKIGGAGSFYWIDENSGTLYTIGGDGVFGYDYLTGRSRSSATPVRRISLRGASIGPSGTKAIAIGDGVVFGIDLVTGQSRQIVADDFGLKDSVFDPPEIPFLDERTVLIPARDGEVVKLDIDTGKFDRVLANAEFSIEHMCTSVDGRYLAMSGSVGSGKGRSGKLYVYDLEKNVKIIERTVNPFDGKMGFADSGRRLVYGDGNFINIVDILSNKTLVRQELKINISKNGRTTTWYKGSVRWISNDSMGGRAVEIGVGGVYGLIYSYNDGVLTLEYGSIYSGEKSGWIIGDQRVAARSADGAFITVIAGIPSVGRPPTDSWLSTHQKIDGKALAIGALKGDRFVVVDDTGAITQFDRQLAEPIMTTILDSDGNWLSRIKGGYFAGTRGAAQNLFLATSVDQTITIDSLFETLYRPDLIAALGSGNSEGTEAGNASPTELASLLKAGLPPKVRIVAPVDSSTAETETIEASAEIRINSGGLGRLEWRVNGITRQVQPAVSSQAAPGGTLMVSAKLLLEPGENEIDLVAFNAANQIASEPSQAKVTLGSAGVVAAPRLFVLSIGIDHYWDSRLKLNYATSDASDVAQRFEAAGKGLFDDVQSWIVIDDKVTRSGLQSVFEEISRKIRSSDVFILYVAGHGKTEDGRYFFIPYDLRYTGPSSIAEQGIGQADWQDWLSTVAARKSLLMFDTCESGTLTEEKITRGFDRIAALDRLTRATGRSVLAASSDDGPALEGFQGHGVFAYSVLEGLGAADPSHTGLIRVTALASYIGERVPELSFGKFGIRQVPQMKLTGEDFSIGRTVASLATFDDAFVPTAATHVILVNTALLDSDGEAVAGKAIDAGTLVRVIASKGDLEEVARSGKRLGYVRSSDLAPLQ